MVLFMLMNQYFKLSYSQIQTHEEVIIMFAYSKNSLPDAPEWLLDTDYALVFNQSGHFLRIALKGDIIDLDLLYGYFGGTNDNKRFVYIGIITNQEQDDILRAIVRCYTECDTWREYEMEIIGFLFTFYDAIKYLDTIKQFIE